MIEPLVPMSACAEMFSDVPESIMFSTEAEHRRNFGVVRNYARKTLRQIGVHAVPFLPNVDGAPRWPVGGVGSMTHCASYRAAAVVARSADLCGVGIDAEPLVAVPDVALDLILRDEERAQLSALADAQPHLHCNRILICAKQAAYKAWFPLTRRFTDVSVTALLDGTYGARLRVRGPWFASIDLNGFNGRWVAGRSLVGAATSVGQCQAARTPMLAGAA